MIIANGGLPEGISGFVYETCIFSQASEEGIDSVEIFINGRLEFDIIRAKRWNRDIQFAENPEEIARRQRDRERDYDDEDSSE